MEPKQKLGRLTIVGLIVTTLWVVALVTIAYNNSDLMVAMQPNAWGDFLAGSFSPLAFFWLVLGHFQQRHELQQNTDALRLQADELKRSVEQQQFLVEATRDQVKAERERYQQLVMPKIVVTNVVQSPLEINGRPAVRLKATLNNEGENATNFIFEWSDPRISVDPNSVAIFVRGAVQHFGIIVEYRDQKQRLEISASYKDSESSRYLQKFSIFVPSIDSMHSDPTTIERSGKPVELPN
jgi:hypothetical protein